MSVELAPKKETSQNCFTLPPFHRVPPKFLDFIRLTGGRIIRQYECDLGHRHPISLLAVDASRDPRRYDTALPIASHRPETYCPDCGHYVTQKLVRDISDIIFRPSFSKGNHHETQFTSIT